MGRPSKFSAETTQLVVDAILRGAGREDAAAAAGICKATLQDWIAKGRAGHPDFLDFLARVEGAERDLVMRAEGVLVDLLKPEVSDAVRFASAKLIVQSRRPKEWRPPRSVEMSGPEGKPVEVAAKVEGQVEVKAEVAVEGGVTATPAFTAAQLAAMSLEQLQALGRGLRGNDNGKEG